jgi:hypothetical protein
MSSDDSKPEILSYYNGTNFRMLITQREVGGTMSRQWAISRPGQPDIVEAFTTADAMKARLIGIRDEMRRANALEQQRKADVTQQPIDRPVPRQDDTPRREARPEPRQFASLIVGTWGDANMPHGSDWVKVPPGELDPGRCRMERCHSPVPRSPNATTIYVVAKKVANHPELATVEMWDYSLSGVYQKAEILDYQQRLRELGLNRSPVRPAPELAKAPAKVETKPTVAEVKPVPKPDEGTPAREQPAVPSESPKFWPVVRYEEPFYSPKTAWLSVVATFTSREDALAHASTLADAAVFPNAFKEDMKRGDRLIAEIVAAPNDENEMKLNRILAKGLNIRLEPEEERAPHSRGQQRAQHAEGTATPEHDRDGEFRPIRVEKPPLPSRGERLWAAVSVVEVDGGGATFEVHELFTRHGAADRYCMLRKEFAVFPRSFDPSEIGKGEWFEVKQLSGYDKDPNAQKLRSLIEKCQATQRPERPRHRPEQGPAQGI